METILLVCVVHARTIWLHSSCGGAEVNSNSSSRGDPSQSSSAENSWKLNSKKKLDVESRCCKGDTWLVVEQVLFGFEYIKSVYLPAMKRRRK